MTGDSATRATRLCLLLSILILPPLLGSFPSATETPESTESVSLRSGDLDLSQWKGRVIWLDFWASWCVPCRASFPWMEEMRKKYAERGLVIVTVNEDQDRAAADRFLAEQPAEFHHVFDPEGMIAEEYDLDAMPTSILFDRSGKPRYRHAGFLPGEMAAYERQIVALLESSPGVAEVPAPPDSLKGRTGRLRPWERDVLARPEMSLDCDPLDLEFDDHIYFSKEASSGGRGFGGGGCGCN